MNRNYTSAQYLDKIDRLREVCPDIAITSDIIAGFPGETPEDFAATAALIETVGFDGLLAFKYSDRPNAPAARFTCKVNENDQNRRLQKILELQENITSGRNRTLVGQTVAVLVESHRLNPGISAGESTPAGDAATTAGTGQWTGRTSTNKIVHMPADGVTTGGTGAIEEGSLIQVTIKKAFAHSLWGVPAESGARNVSGMKGESSHAA